jgi:hypothetical protein
MANAEARRPSTDWPAFFGRWTLLLLLAGHLLLRREFAHRNLGDLFALAKMPGPGFLSYGFVTETALLCLLPLAILTLLKTRLRGAAPPGEAALQFGLGPASYLVLAFLLWIAGHALVALIRPPHDVYLIFRQSALGAYALVFIYTLVFFGNQAEYVRQAAAFSIAVALLCAGLDTFGLLDPKPGTGGQYPDEHLFGQQTLPLGILALGLYIIHIDSVPWRVVAVIGLALLGWREGRRVPQSAVVMGLAGALCAYVALGATLAWRGQSYTLKRAILLAGFFGVLFLGYRTIHKIDTAEKTEMRAWAPKTYEDLFAVYEFTRPPSAPNMKSLRPPFDMVTDPEAYKLAAVYDLAQEKGGVSVVNNIWRLLVWRRMLTDFEAGHPLVGAGVGKPWFYPALYQTRFHYGEEREGLDPHNSFLNVMYRYGAVGLVLFLSAIVAVLIAVWRALRIQPSLGDPLLEGLVLFFAYSAVFACFTVSLEGPSYAMPFWMSLGLVYAYARQILAVAREGLM